MWKRQLIGFEILVDTIVDMFGPPDTNEVFELQGKVRVVTSKPLNLKGLLVSFHGTTQVNKEDKPRKVLSYMNLTLNDMSLLSPDTPSVLPAGVSDFPFKFALSGDLPPSTYTTCGSIQYKITSVLISSRTLRATSKVDRPIILCRHYIPSHEIIPHVPKTLLQGEQEGKLKCEFSVPSLVWIQDEKITVEGKITPLVEDARIANVHIKLEQIEEFRTISKNDGRPSFFVFENIPQHFMVFPVSPYNYTLPTHTPLSTEIPVTLHLNIQSPRVKCRVDSPLIEIEHIVRIRVSFVDPHQRPLWLSTPITITTVPSASDSIATTPTAAAAAARVHTGAHHGETLPGYDDPAHASAPVTEASHPDLLALTAASRAGLPGYSALPNVLAEPVATMSATPGHLSRILMEDLDGRPPSATEAQSMYSRTNRRFGERFSVLPRMNSMPTMWVRP